jgi:hypothetical protein
MLARLTPSFDKYFKTAMIDDSAASRAFFVMAYVSVGDVRRDDDGLCGLA